MTNNTNKQNVSGNYAPFTFICVLLALTSFGLVSMFSASYENAIRAGLNTTYYFTRQLIALLVAVALSISVQFVPKKLLKLALVILYVLLVGFLISSLFYTSLDLDAGLQSIIILTTLSVFTLFHMKKPSIGKTIIALVSNAIVITLLILLGLKASALLIIIIDFLLLIFLGFKIRYLLWIVLIFALPTLLYLLSSVDKVNQALTYLSRDALDTSSLAYDALVRGGGMGQGLGSGILKLQENFNQIHTNYIFASAIEETGLIGITLTFILYGLLFLLGIRCANRLRDLNYDGYSLFVYAIMSFIMMQVIFHLLNILNLTTNVYATLMPLMSYSPFYIAFLILLLSVVYRFMRLTTKLQKKQIQLDEENRGYSSEIVFYNGGM